MGGPVATASTMIDEPLLIGVREAARALGLGRDSAYRLVRERRLRSVRVGRRVLIPRSECEAFVRREADRDTS